MSELHLHLKFCYFDAIERGEKAEEYRGLHWLKRIEGRQFDSVVLWRGFERRFIKCPWRGFVRKVITHPHFGNVPTEVLAIAVAAQPSLAGDGETARA